MNPILATSRQFPNQGTSEKFKNQATIGEKLRKTLLGLSLDEATFVKREFLATNPRKQQHIERIGKTFLQGYNEAIAFNDPRRVIPQLNPIDPEYRGFAFEGAAMGLALLDRLTPWNSQRIAQFLEKEGQNHIYMTYVGIGWLLARFPGAIKAYLQQLEPPESQPFPDPLLGWLAIDGYGFHQGYFHWRQYIQGIAIPQELSGYSCRVFDQGLGRSLWFVKGANIPAIQASIQQFQPNRRADLWSGVGLACGYAGGVELREMEQLKDLGKTYLKEIRQGVAFAAKTRLRAENLTEKTEIACRVLCGMSASEAANITDQTLNRLSHDGHLQFYEQWRQQIQQQFS